MNAAFYTEFGTAQDVLQVSDQADTAPQPGEVTVELHFSGVNPSDVKARRGGRPGVTKPPFPVVIPHSDGAGVITAVGAGVDPARVGQAVWIWNGQWQRASGTAASHITLPAEQAVALPDGVSMETGAILGIPGLTACHAVFGGGEVSGQTVVISGGGGTVGYLAVQLAHWGGARVIATASPRDFERVKAAGADVVLDYRVDDLAAQVLAANNGVMVERMIEVEFGANIDLCTEVIAPNGTIAAYGSAIELSPTLPFYPLLFKAVTIDIILIYLLQLDLRLAEIDRLHRALTEGALHCPVAEVFDLSDTASAHEAVEAGGRTGAILINCQGS